MSINSKKLVSIALTASTVLWAAGIASLPLANAQTTSSLQAQIAALLAQIQQLQGQLGTSGSTTTSSMSYSFTNNLTVGSTGADVNALQQLLISKGYLTGVSAPTGYFGSLTMKALAAWQASVGIKPASGYFGPITRAYINSMNVGTTTTTTTTGTGTTTTTTGTTTTAPATGLQVSLANDNPSNGSLISTAVGQTGSGAARVPVLAVNFTAGNSGAVTLSGVNFHKTGVLADSSINGAYLIQNGQVVAQYNSISNGVISFSGLNLSIPAGQTEEYQLAIDVAGQLSAGNTTGFSLNAATDVTAWDTNNNAVTPVGSFPLTGSIFTVTTVSNPSLASLQITSSSIGTQVTAGSQANLVGAWVFQVGNSPVWLKSIAFHVIGSANMANLQNVKLVINGTQGGATLSSVGANNIAYFNLTSAPVQLNTGNNNVQIFSDVTGSPFMNFQFEILNSYDVLAVDSQYNVPITVKNTSGIGAQVNIQQGQITLTQDAGTPTGQVAVGQSGVTLAKFDLYAAGEPVKVQFLGFKLAFTGATTTLSNMVKNISLTDDAGGQIGTTINTPPSGNTCDVGPNGGNGPAGYSANGTAYVDCFGTSGSPINYTIPANTTRVLSLKADIQSGATFSTVVASLLPESNNLQGMTSGQPNSTSGSTGSSLSLSTSLLSAAQNSSFGNQRITPNSTDVQIGSYSLTASSASGANITTISIKPYPNGSGSSDIQNLKVIFNGAQFGTNANGTITDGQTYTFSGNGNIQAGQTANVNVYADILSNATSSNGAASALTGCSGSSVVSYSALSCSGSINGQSVTIATTGATMTVGLDSSAPSPTNLVMGTTGNLLAAYRFAETSNVENVKITDLTITQNTTSGKSAFQVNNNSGLALYNSSGASLGTSNSAVTSTAGYVYTFHFTNPIIVPQANSVTVNLKADVASYNSAGAADNSTSTFTISSANVTALGQSSNIATQVVGNATSSVMTVLRTILTPSAAAVGVTSGRSKSATDNIATVTFSPNSSGAAILKKLTLTFSGSAIATSTPASTTYNGGGYGLASNIKLLDQGNIDVTNPSSIFNGATATSSCTSQSACTVTWTFISAPTSTGAAIISTPYVFTVQLNDQAGNGTVAGSNGISQGLSATIQNTTDVQYLDATDGTGSTVSLPANIVPLPVVSTSFSQGT